MTRSRLILTLSLLALGLCGGTLAQEDPPAVTLVPPDVQELHWGAQTLTFGLTNNTDYIRFIVVQQTMTVDGKYENTQRVLTTNNVLWPGETREIDVTIEIPGIFGSGTVLVSLFDVVDTLDAIYPGYDIYQRNLTFSFDVPDGLLDYAQADPEVPPRVGKGMDFNYDFARQLVMLLEEGRSVSEIAGLVECSESYVTETIDSMISRQYLKHTGEGPHLAMPYITAAHAQRASVKIDSLAAQFADRILENLGHYKPFLDSLVAAGAVATDSNDFMDPGTVIYRRYAMTVPMLLWYDLGQEFISKPAMLFIFENSDPCNAWIPRYMYMVEQGEQYNGDQFFLMTAFRHQAMKLVYSDHVPMINCPEQYWKLGQPLHENAHWRYEREELPENFVIDTARVHQALRRLRTGLEEPLNAARADARARGEAVGADRNPYGYRYWYWNLLATKITARLIDAGAIQRPGNGNLRFEVFK